MVALIAEAQEMRLQAQRAQQEAARRLKSTLQEEVTQMEVRPAKAMSVEAVLHGRCTFKGLQLAWQLAGQRVRNTLGQEYSFHSLCITRETRSSTLLSSL